ncbi:MAG TPA: hypothetical protein VKB76_14340, partial [Ktedonobacterales bacterium]|nr:hypothetical protein [Ktedonobacterales bacterium]
REPPLHRDPSYVRIHLLPPDGDFFSAPSGWVYEVMQDILPPWYVAEVEKERMWVATCAWQKSHVFHGANGIAIDRPGVYLLRNCRNVRLGGSSEIYLICRSHVTEMGDDVIATRVGDGSTIDVMRGNARIESLANAIVRRIGASASIVGMHEGAQVGVATDEATIGAMNNDARIETLAGCAKVGYLYGTASIALMRDSAQVGEMWEQSSIASLEDDATIGAMRGDTAVRAIRSRSAVGFVAPRVSLPMSAAP